MLSRLQVKNYVLIDSLEIDFPKGLIIITGQTGAGKSILLGAVDLLLGGRTADIRLGAGAEPAGGAGAQLDALFAQRTLQRLRVGVADDEVHAFQVRLDHVVDGVAAGPADAEHGDARLQLGLDLGNGHVDHAVQASTTCFRWV